MTSREEMKAAPPQSLGKRLLYWASWGLIGVGGLFCLVVWTFERSRLSSSPHYLGGPPGDYVHYVEVAFPWLHGAGTAWFATRSRWPRVGAALWLGVIVVLYVVWSEWLLNEFGLPTSNTTLFL